MVGTPGQDHARVADGDNLLAPSATRNPAQPQALTVMPSLLARLAERYLREEVYGIQADATFRAKASDLGSFIAWFTQHNRTPDAPWIKQDTVDFLKNLERGRRAPATINRVLATLKSFALWAYEQPGSFLQLHGLPTRGVSAKATPPPACRKLSDTAVRRLVKAASLLTCTRTHANQRPWRDRAILAVLLHTGLRAHELASLQLWQYTKKALLRVRRKGRGETPLVYLPLICREAVEEYILQERAADAGADACTEAYPDPTLAPLFLVNGHAMHRQYINEVINTIAREASKNDPERPLHVSPHMLRHTFGARHREASGSDTETAAALGHTGMAHVGRYTRKTDDERAATIEGMF